MWNSFKTDGRLSITAEIATYAAAGGDEVHAYLARPRVVGLFPGIVLLHHTPGWDEFHFECAERLARHGYTVLCPDLYCRLGHGTPDEVAAKVQALGGVYSDSVVADAKAALEWLTSLPTANGKVGIMGMSGGGRNALLAASRVRGFAAVVDLWGGQVVMTDDEFTPARPVATIDYTKELDAPLLGIFGNDDHFPTREQVDIHEEVLKRHKKCYEFHRYDGAGHAFFYYHTSKYRPAQAMDGWQKIFAFFERYLQT